MKTKYRIKKETQRNGTEYYWVEKRDDGAKSERWKYNSMHFSLEDAKDEIDKEIRHETDCRIISTEYINYPINYPEEE